MPGSCVFEGKKKNSFKSFCFLRIQSHRILKFKPSSNAAVLWPFLLLKQCSSPPLRGLSVKTYHWTKSQINLPCPNVQPLIPLTRDAQPRVVTCLELSEHLQFWWLGQHTRLCTWAAPLRKPTLTAANFFTGDNLCSHPNLGPGGRVPFLFPSLAEEVWLWATRTWWRPPWFCSKT